jgi:catechol 2,3-dioxygenase-like lactoylglutathione lyase family enzyme
MFSHVMVGSNDIARSKKFYDALFGAVGGKPGAQDAKGRLIYAHNGGRLMVAKPIDGKARTAARRSRIRPVSARVPPGRYTWLIFAIPTAPNCARFIACRLPEPSSRVHHSHGVPTE